MPSRFPHNIPINLPSHPAFSSPHPFLQSADEWVDAVGERRFLGGDAPDLADLAVFGVVRSITATDTFNDLMQHSRIGGWYVRMFEAVGPPSRLL